MHQCADVTVVATCMPYTRRLPHHAYRTAALRGSFRGRASGPIRVSRECNAQHTVRVEAYSACALKRKYLDIVLARGRENHRYNLYLSVPPPELGCITLFTQGLSHKR